MNELDARSRAILAASRRADALPTDVDERVWRRLERDVAPARVARRVWVPALVGLAVAAGVAAIWWGGDRIEGGARVAADAAGYDARVEAADSASLDAEPGSAATTRAAVPVPAELPAVPTTMPTTMDLAPDAAPQREVTTPSRAPVVRPSAAEPAPDPFADELARLRAAQATLASAPADVLVQLDALDRDHPRGAMQPERAALRVLATCAAGSAAKARDLAADFETRHASSPLLGRVRAACTSP